LLKRSRRLKARWHRAPLWPESLRFAAEADSESSIPRTHRPALILDNFVLNGRGSDKETRHLELSLEGSGLEYEPGDSLGIVVENDPLVVNELIEALRLKPEEPVPDGTGDVPLATALARHYEITTITPRFVERYAELADAALLRNLVRPEKRSDLLAYLYGRHIIDLVEEFPAARIRRQDLCRDVAQVAAAALFVGFEPGGLPGEAHLTIAIVRYESHGRIHKGVASAYLGERRSLDDTVLVYRERNEQLSLALERGSPDHHGGGRHWGCALPRLPARA
jgi:sulfite reductase (NADPH) flavoprotein alpha-component